MDWMTWVINIVIYCVLLFVSLGLIYLAIVPKNKYGFITAVVKIIKYIKRTILSWKSVMNSEDLEIDDIGKCGAVMVLPEQFWALFWNEEKEFDLEQQLEVKGYKIIIHKVCFKNTIMEIELSVKNQKGKIAKINKWATVNVGFDEKAESAVIENTDKIRISKKDIIPFNIYSDTEITVEIKVSRKEVLNFSFYLPLKKEGVIKNVRWIDYMGFCSFGGFVGLASLIGTVIFCLLAFFKLFIAGILFGVTILIIGVGLNRRLYALLRNNIQN